MASVVVKVVDCGRDTAEAVYNALQILNTHQEAFYFEPLTLRYAPSFCESASIVSIFDIYDQVSSATPKGYHPLIIIVSNQRLKGKIYSNLLGAVEYKDGRQTGKAVTTSYEISSLLGEIPIEVFFVYEFMSFAIRFAIKDKMIHDREEDRGCLFHRKADKRDIVTAIRSGYISRECLEKIQAHLDLQQINALQYILAILGEISRSEQPLQLLRTYLGAVSAMADGSVVRKPTQDSAHDELIAQLIAELPYVHERIQQDIQDGLGLYSQKSFVNSCRILCPCVEALLDEMLVSQNEDPTNHTVYRGIVSKIRKLEKLTCISPDLARSIDIFLARVRNASAHGSFNPRRGELAYPLSIATIVYLTHLIREKKEMTLNS